MITKKVGESDENEEEPASSPSDERVDYPKCEGANAHVCSYEGEPLGVYTISLHEEKSSSVSYSNN